MTYIDPCKIKSFVILSLFIIVSNGSGQSQNFKDSVSRSSSNCINGIHTLSIHTRDTAFVDSIFIFLKDKLKLPVYYKPVTIGSRKYAGIYAGNLVLEPCGPYDNRGYAMDDFRAIFYGLNFSVSDSLKHFEIFLNERDISHQMNKGSIYIRDTLLSHENIFTALYEIRDWDKRDSLQNRLDISRNGPGIENICKIATGYSSEGIFQRWKAYLFPLEIKNELCRINDSLEVRFTRSKINEVKDITFKVRSLKKARQFLEKNHLLFESSSEMIRLDPGETFGLTIYLNE